LLAGTTRIHRINTLSFGELFREAFHSEKVNQDQFSTILFFQGADPCLNRFFLGTLANNDLQIILIVVHAFFCRRSANNNNGVQKIECADNRCTRMYNKSEANKNV
jgi:hypothetical protein